MADISIPINFINKYVPSNMDVDILRRITHHGIAIGFDTEQKPQSTNFIKIDNCVFAVVGDVSFLQIMAVLYFRINEFEQKHVFPALCREILFKYETPENYVKSNKINTYIWNIMLCAKNTKELITFAFVLCDILRQSTIFAVDMHNTYHITPVKF